MTLDDRARALKPTVAPGISLAAINRCTDFAIDANDAGRADLSIALLAPLTHHAPRTPRVWQLLALAYRFNQQSELALKCFARAAALAPRDAKIAAGHATVALEAGLPSALLFKTALDLTPNDPELLLSTTAALKADGHVEVAETLLVRAVAANPGWVRGHEALATLRWTTTRADDFARSFADACAHVPTDLALRLAWQRVLVQSGQLEAARMVIDDGRSLVGNITEFDAAEAHMATESGDDARAEQLFSRTRTLDDPGIRISHVRHCLRTGQIDDAERIVYTLLNGPAAARAWPYLSVIWLLKGDSRATWLDGAPPMIGIYDLPFEDGELAVLAECLRSLHLTRNHPAEQSLRGGTQTEGLLFSRIEPAIQALRAKVLHAVRLYVDGLPPSDPTHPLLGAPRGDLLFSGSWSVRLGSQGFHICHTHPFGWISSALYVALPDVEALGPSPAGWLELGRPPPDLRLDLPAYERVEPKPGRLVLFPSTMWHGTVPFNDGERLTVAFDVAVPGR